MVGLTPVYLLKEDLNLVKQCQQGDAKAFEALYKCFSPKLYAICLRYAKDTDEAADILQEAFIKVFQRIKSFEFKGSFEGWLKSLTVHTAIDFYNRNKRDKLNFEETMESHDEESDAVDALSELSHQDLLKLISQLPKGYKMVFNLYVVEGFKHHEIASMLGINEGTSKSQLAKAKEVLKKQIKQLSSVAA